MVASSTNILLVLCWLGFNEFTVFSSNLFYLFYPILILLPLTVTLYIVVGVAAVYRYLVGPTPRSLSGFVVLGSVPSLPWNHPVGFSVAI